MTDKERQYISFVRNYILATSLHQFVFAYAIYSILFKIRGLTLLEISLLLAWWGATSAALEIPSGALADHWSRRNMLILAPLIKALCFLTWLVAGSSVWMFGLGFLFWSISASMISGTAEALLYDELTAFKKKKEYERILGQKQFYVHIATALSTISGGIIAHFNIDLVLIVTAIPLLLSSFFAMLMKETPIIQSTQEVQYLQYISLAYKEVKTNSTLKIFILYSVAITALWYLEEFDQLYYELVGLPIFIFGFIIATWALLNAIGSYYAHKLKRSHWILYTFPFIAGILTFLVGYKPKIPMVALLLLTYFITSPLYVLMEGKIQHSIKSLGRATITSVNALAINATWTIVLPFLGMLGHKWGLEAIYMGTGIFLFVFSIWAYLNKTPLSATTEP